MRDRGRRFALLGVAILVAVSGLTLGAARPALADDPVQVLLLLDVSGSMNEKVSSGGTKLAAAKGALKRVADSLPAGTQVGLRVYGSKIKEPKAENPKACQDTELVMPVGPLDRDRMYGAVDSFQAVGETPIAYSLEQSVKDLGDQGRRVVVLISDGEENCVPDPCPVAKKLAAKGVDLQFNAVGFDVNAKARKQLQCIVDETDGSYYDAEDTDELNDSLDKLTKRALRPFAISGKPVVGTVDQQSAPTIGPGQYQDRYDSSGESRFYRIERTTPGSNVSVAASTIVPPARGFASEVWDIALRSAETMEVCDRQTFGGSGSDGSADLTTGAVATLGAPDPCADGPLYVLLERAAAAGGPEQVRVELAVVEEPPIANLAELPPGLSDPTIDRTPVAAAKQVQAVVGGVAFSDAPQLRAGSYRSEIVVGETLVYQIEVQPGQRLRATLDAPRAGADWGFESNSPVEPGIAVYSPGRYGLDDRSGAISAGNPAKSVRTTAATAEIRIRNREIDPSSHEAATVLRTATGGTYYLVVRLRPGQSGTLGVLTPIQLNLAVDGKPAGLPVYGAPTPSPGPSSPATSTPDPSSSGTPEPTPPASASPGPGDSSSPGPIGNGSPGVGGAVAAVLGILGVLVVAGAVVVLVLRRRAAARARESAGSDGTARPEGPSGPPAAP